VTRFAPLLLLLTAAAPSPYLGSRYSATLPQPIPVVPAPAAAAPASPYQPAPMPNRDLSAPAAVASNEPSISPTLFSSQRQFRGDGYMGNSSEQSAHDHALKPAAGLNLSMPLNSW
jgi:hypothetical protein